MKVPTYEEGQVQAQGIPDVRVNAGSIAPGLQALQQGVADVAQATQTIRHRAATSAAKDASTAFAQQMNTALYDPEGGFFSKNGKDAFDGFPAMQAQLLAQQQEAAKALKDPEARRMFTEDAQSRLSTVNTQMMAHARKGLEDWQDASSAARIDSYQQQAALAYNDPDAQAKALAAVRGEIAEKADRKGLGHEYAMAEIRDATSKTYALTAQHMGLDDPATAIRFIDQHTDVIDPATQIALREKFKTATELQDAGEVGNWAIGGGGPVPNGDATGKDVDRIFNVGIIGQESGGRNGLISPAGAMGVAQVMPATAKAMCDKLGIAYDPVKLRNDPQYCITLGRAYFHTLLERYHGNTTMAVAAYNAGPGNVDKWAKAHGDPRKGEISNADWAAKIPVKETNAYVPGVFRRVNGSNSAPVNSAQRSTADQEAAALARIDSLPLSEDRKTKAREFVTKHFAINNRLADAAESDAFDSAMKVAVDPTFTSLSMLPQETLSALKGEHLHTLDIMAKQNAKGEDVPPNPDVNYKLSRLAGENPEAFAKLDLRPYATQLPRSEWNGFVNLQRQALRNGGKDAAKVPAVASWSKIWGLTRNTFEAAGYTVGGKAKDDDKAAITAFQHHVVSEVAAFTAEHKKPPSDEQIQAIGDKALMRVWDSTAGKGVKLFEAEGLTKAGHAMQVEVPNDARQRIIASFQRKTGTMPSEVLIASSYLQHKGEPGFW